MLFIQRLIEDPQIGIMQIVAVVFSVCCHEYSHARVALWQGDSTAADAGHLTLNPLKQMGPFSIVMLLFIGIAWGAVPVNPGRMRHNYSRALVSFAGPAMNILLFLLFSILFCAAIVLFSEVGFSELMTAYKIAGVKGMLAVGLKNSAPITFFYIAAQLNIALFILNMLPIPILDGWNVFNYFFPSKINFNSEFAKGAILLLFFGIFFAGDWLFSAGHYALLGVSWWVFKVISIFGG